MENNQSVPAELLNPDYSKIPGTQNLHWILVEEHTKDIIISSVQKYTGIEHSLSIDKNRKVVRSKSNSKARRMGPPIRRYLFSSFIGIFKFKGLNYLLFAENVTAIRFAYDTVVFEIATVIALSMQSFLVDLEVTEYCNIVFTKVSYFSYDLDLTQPITRDNVETFRSKKSPIWPFFMNRNLLRTFLNDKVAGWLIPIIFGHIQSTTIGLESLSKKGTFYMVTRTSVLNVLDKKADDPVVETLTSSDKISHSCMIFDIEGTYTGISFGMNNLPAKEIISLKHTCRFYQFIKNNFTIALYIVCLEKGYDFEYVANMKSSKIVDMLNIVNILFLDKLSRFVVAEIFKESIENYISVQSSNINTVFFSVPDIESFFDLYMPYIASLFIYHSRNILCHQSASPFYNESPSMHTFEVSMTKLLSNYSKKRNVINQIHRYFDKKANSGFISSVFTAIKSLITGSDNIASENVIMETRNLIFTLFSVHENVIQRIIQEYRDSEEKIFDATELKLTIITHNCSGFKPVFEEDQEQFNYHKVPQVLESDIVCICLQEILAMKSENLKNILLEDNFEVKNAWRLFLSKLFSDKFEVLYTKNLLGLLTIIFIKRGLIKKYDIKIHKTEFLRLGKFKFANKACILIRMSVNYEKIDFMNCHLSSGINEVDMVRRVQDLRKVYSIVSKDKEPLISFIAGDLNFRSKIELQQVQNQIKAHKEAKDLKKHHRLVEEILEFDELTKVLQQKDFSELHEHQVRFLPSYRFYVGTKEYDVAAGKRIPSWCDRVLFKRNFSTSFLVDKYILDEETMISDHKPVIFVSRISIKEYNTPLFHKLFDEKY